MRCSFVGLAVALVLSLGAPPQAHGHAEPDLAAVGALAQEAQTLYDTADYAGAIDLWTEAFAALPEEPAYAQQRSVLVYQIAQASVEAYAMDPQVLYLRKAERLFTAYLETIEPTDTETRAEVEATIADLRRRIEEVEESSLPAGERETTANEEGDDAPGAVEDRAPQEPARPPSSTAAPGRGRAMTIAGAVVLGLGVASLAPMTYGLVWGEQVDKRGEAMLGEPKALLAEGNTANRLAIGAGVASAVAVIIGASLLGVGLSRRRSSRLARGRRTMQPFIGGGLSFALRF